MGKQSLLIADNLTYLIEMAVDGVGSSYFGENSVSIDYSNDVSNVKTNPYRIIPLNNEITTISFDLSIKDDAIVNIFGFLLVGIIGLLLKGCKNA